MCGQSCGGIPVLSPSDAGCTLGKMPKTPRGVKSPPAENHREKLQKSREIGRFCLMQLLDLGRASERDFPPFAQLVAAPKPPPPIHAAFRTHLPATPTLTVFGGTCSVWEGLSMEARPVSLLPFCAEVLIP